MTEKEYKLEQWTDNSLYYSFPNGNLHHSISNVLTRVEKDLNALHEENTRLKQELSDVYVEKGSNEYYKQLFEEKCKEIEVLEKRVNWFIECIEQMGYKVVRE